MRGLVLMIAIALAGQACSVRKFAINKIGDALAQGGSTYESDEDVELVRGALPFGLKLIESLIAESPKHKGLLLAASQGFTSFSYIDVQQELDIVEISDLDAARQLRTRVRRLYMRGHVYGMTALELAHPGLGRQLEADPKGAVHVLRKPDVPLIYWTAAGLGLAIAASKDDVSMLARIPEVEALLDRALELDPAWNNGALHEFWIVLAAAKPGKPDAEKVQGHFANAFELSKGQRASLFVSFAESVCVPQQNREEFTRFIEKALAIDVDRTKEIRLLNLVAQRRARWLLGRVDDLILGGN